LRKLAVIEDYIQRHHHVGDLTSKHGYLAAHAEMGWKPLDDNETVLFCGYAGTLLVVLGGSISHLVGHSSAQMQIGSHPHTIQAAVLYGDEPRDLGRDLEATAQEVCSTPQPVKFLARIISRGPLHGGSVQAEYLLATPLYVEAVDTPSV
jgi:hypothetical protein